MIFLSPIAEAYLAGLLTGAFIGLPSGLVLALWVLPRSMDLWAKVTRRATRPHER